MCLKSVHIPQKKEVPGILTYSYLRTFSDLSDSYFSLRRKRYIYVPQCTNSVNVPYKYITVVQLFTFNEF